MQHRVGQADIAVTAKPADTWQTRLIGFLGCRPEQINENLYLPHTRLIHTFGMAAPLDVVYLDTNHRILATEEAFPPRRISKKVVGCRSILEMPAGEGRRCGLVPGATVHLHFEDNIEIRARARRMLIHYAVNILLATLWLNIAQAAYARFQQSSSFLPLLLFVFNTLIVIFFLIRRPNRYKIRRWPDWSVPVGVVLLSFMLRPLHIEATSLAYLSAVLQMLGISGMLFSLASLGRSFGIVPGHRGLQTQWAYRFVRHPLYASELVFYTGFVLGNWDAFNATLVMAIALGQIWRANAEEKVLSLDREYIAYCQRTPFRFIHGVY